jgi:hypothetical protein
MKYIALALTAMIFGLVSCKSSAPTNTAPSNGGYVQPRK